MLMLTLTYTAADTELPEHVDRYFMRCYCNLSSDRANFRGQAEQRKLDRVFQASARR